MIVPTIHLNGTSRETLYEGYLAAYQAIEDAIQALNATAPDGRDYYPQGRDVIVAAESEHHWRIIELRKVRAQLEVLVEATLPK